MPACRLKPDALAHRCCVIGATRSRAELQAEHLTPCSGLHGDAPGARCNLQGSKHVVRVDAVSARHVGDAVLLDKMTEAGQ